MNRLRSFCAALALAAGLALGLLPASTMAQNTDAPGPVGGVPAKLPEIKLPGMDEIRVTVPRTVQALSNALGYGRQRLALVVGIGTVGTQAVVDSAARDTQAVAAALRAGGFVVMVREDVTGADLRASLKEFHDRLQPGAIGFVYLTGLGAQIDGRNLLLPRDAVLDATLPAERLDSQLRSAGVPLQDVVEALMGTLDSPRLLVVDAAYRHPALASLAQPGLGEQSLPPGMMALFGQALAAVQDVPAVSPLPNPVPTDPREVAATRFARVLVGTLVTPRVTPAEALRATRNALVNGSNGELQPWIAGDTESREDLSEVTLLDALVPRTPEDLAREAAKQALDAATGRSRAGEQRVTDVLQQSTSPAPSSGASETASDAASGRPSVPNTRTVPELPSTGGAAGGGGSSLGSALDALGSAASAVGAAAGVAGQAAGAAAAVKVAEAAVVASAAGSAVSAASSVVGSVASAGQRILSSSAGEGSARQGVQQAVQAAAPSAAAPAAAGAAAAPVAPPAAAPAVAPAAAPPVVPPAAPGVAAAAAAAGDLPVEAVLAAPAAAPAVAAAPTAAAAPAAATVPAAPAAGATAASTATAAARQMLDGRTERSPDGGERPAFSPRINNYGYAEGDTFSYQVIDAWKNEVTGSYTTAIEEVLGDGELMANGQSVQMDAQGRIKVQQNPDGSVAQFEPHQDLWWSKPQPGQSRDVRFVESFRRGRVSGQTEWKGSASVGRARMLQTPAGEFEVLPIETSGWYYETLANGVRNSGQFSRTVWYSTKLGHPVQIDIQDADRLGKLLRRERVELTHAQLGRGTP